MEAKFDGKPMSLETLREIEKRQRADEPAVENEAEAEYKDESKADESFLDDTPTTDKLTEPDTPQQNAEVKMDLNPEGNTYVEEKREEKKEQGEDVLSEEHHENAKMQGADVEDAREQTKVDEAHAKDIALDAAVAQQQEAAKKEESRKSSKSGKGGKKGKTPVDPQQQADVKMDLNPEFNQQNQPGGKKDKANTQQTQDVMKADNFDLEHKEGADVSDARAQTKVDEARARDAARDTAVGKQQEHREAPDTMKDITEQYDKSKSDAQAGNESEYI
jgi:hypothetical protein